MRYDSGHKSETRKRVLTEAARDIREKGPGGVAVAGIMARAGLTHGGFYAHFKSKDELIAEAIGVMFEDARGRLFRVTDNPNSKEGLATYIDGYLSPAHRDARSRGCPLPSLSGDMARLEPLSRERFGQGVEAIMDRIAGMLEASGAENPKTEASAVMSQMVGALALARAVADPGQSDHILETTRADLKRRYDVGADHE